MKMRFCFLSIIYYTYLEGGYCKRSGADLCVSLDGDIYLM